MTVFIGTSLNDRSQPGQLTGFTGGTLADRSDAIGDIYLAFEGNDNIIGGSGNDYINGGDGDDVIGMSGGTDILDGGNGIDVYVRSPGLSSFVWDMTTGLTNKAGEIAINFENANLGTGNDTVKGNAANNVIQGNNGNDTLDGRSGNDLLIGGAGDDVIAGGLGFDRSDGGTGIDTFDMRGALFLDFGTFNLSLLTGVTNFAGERAINFENVIGNGAANNIDCTNGANTISGNAGNDQVNGRGGADTISGDAGEDKLAGDLGNDVINGGIGNDVIFGQQGNDTLTGGAGNDEFAFDKPLIQVLGINLNVDTITDFSSVADRFLIYNDVFTSLAAGALNAAALRLGPIALDATDRIVYNQATGNLFFDADGFGGTAQLMFAKVTPGTAINLADFFVI